MFSNDSIEWTVFDEGSIPGFNLSTCLDSKCVRFTTHFLREGSIEVDLFEDVPGQINRNDF